MQRVLDYFADHAANLMIGFTFLLGVYLIARLLRASPIVALAFAALPVGVLYLVQHPHLSSQLMAGLR